MKLNIYLIRHGDAESISKGMKDFDRGLTDEGSQKMKETAQKWKSFIPHFDYIVSSPYKRAYQTASIIAETFSCKDKLITDNRIGCGSSVVDIIEIANSMDCEHIAFVGHQPDMSEHVSSFICNSFAYVEFKKGMLAKISFHSKAREGKGTLDYLIAPGCLIKG